MELAYFSPTSNMEENTLLEHEERDLVEENLHEINCEKENSEEEREVNAEISESAEDCSNDRQHPELNDTAPETHLVDDELGVLTENRTEEISEEVCSDHIR